MTDWSFDPGSERYVSVATFRQDGSEVRTPVWLARVDDAFYLFSAGEVGKVKRVRNNGRARLAACDARGNVHANGAAAWLDAEARIVDDAELLRRVYRALRQKYGWQMRLLDFFSGLSGRKQKRAVIELRVTGASAAS